MSHILTIAATSAAWLQNCWKFFSVVVQRDLKTTRSEPKTSIGRMGMDLHQMSASYGLRLWELGLQKIQELRREKPQQNDKGRRQSQDCSFEDTDFLSFFIFGSLQV